MTNPLDILRGIGTRRPGSQTGADLDFINPQQSSAQLTQGGGGGGRGSSDWLKPLLIMGALMATGQEGKKKGEPAPKGGYKLPEKPIMAQALHSLAQGLEKKAQGEQMLKQAEQEQKQKQEKETFERQFKMYVEQMKGKRAKADIESREKIAGMRTAEPEPTEFETEKQRLTLETMQANLKGINARTSKTYADLKKDNDPKAEMFNIPKTYQKYYTPAATDVYADLDDAYKRAVGGDRAAFDAVRSEIESRKGEMVRTTTNAYGQTQTDVQDQSNLLSLWSWMDTQLTSAGVESTQEGDIAEMVRLFNAGEYEKSENIGMKYGLTTDQYKDYVQPPVRGGAEGGFLGSR